MGMIPQEIIDRVLDQLDIVEVVSDYIPIKKAGRNFKGCCPFHNEKTPSFVVSPDKQIYHCFGCAAGGNSISFVMKYENMEFPEALRQLAAKAGVDVPRTENNRDDGVQSEISRLYDVNEAAAVFFQNALKSPAGRPAMEYLKRRGITDETLNEFRIGYAPKAWEALKQHCEKGRISATLLRKAGLTIPSEKGKGDYDRFRNRIIFPVFNERGRIVAFGGRVLDDSLPKYINSPETALYVKSNVLYGLNSSRRSIREKGHAVIVEGYMDVVLPSQYGIKNAVAASGTALTTSQARMLKKYTDTAVMVFDADQAGEAASLRGLDVLLEHGIKVRIVTLPQGEDPDSFVKKNGKEGFDVIVAEAKDLFDYKLDLLVDKLGARDIGGIADEMLPTIAKVDNAVVQSAYMRRLAERLGVHEASLRHEIRKVSPPRDRGQATEEKKLEGDGDRVYRASEVHILGLVMLGRNMLDTVREELGLDSFRDPGVRRAIAAVEDLYGSEGTNISPGKLLGRIEREEDVRGAVINALAQADITQDPEKALKDCIARVKRDNRDDELKELATRLRKAQQSHNDAEMRALLDKINRIHKEKVT